MQIMQRDASQVEVNLMLPRKRRRLCNIQAKRKRNSDLVMIVIYHKMFHGGRFVYSTGYTVEAQYWDNNINAPLTEDTLYKGIKEAIQVIMMKAREIIYDCDKSGINITNK